MLETLGKVLSYFVFPWNASLFLLALAVLFWRRRASRWLALAGLALQVIFSLPVVSQALVSSLERQNPETLEDAPAADAIVVLGGVIHIPAGQHTHSGLLEPSDRLLEAFRLYRAGKAPLVVCSGGNNPLYGERPVSEAKMACGLLVEWGIPQQAILLEDGSINTRQNAELSYRLLAPRGLRRVLLVTSAQHMPRAAAAFRKAGFTVTPAPADFHTGWGAPLLKWLPDSSSFRRSEAALQEWLGLLVYRWRGWT